MPIPGYGGPLEPPVPSSSLVWRQLRQLRSAPPGLAGHDEDRRSLFHAAIEQSEQLFRGASQADYAVRPLLAFYGLSQAGRAIASIAVAENDGKLHGHGISCRDLTPDLCDLKLRPLDGAFEVLCRRLAGASWTKAVTFGAVWAAIPELKLRPLSTATHAPALGLLLGQDRQTSWGVRITGVPAEVLPAFGADTGHLADEGAFDQYLNENYPRLHMLKYRPPYDWQAALDRDGRTVTGIRTLEDDPGELRQYPDVLRTLGTPYLGQHWTFPDPGEAGVAAHPIMLWWALMFALSMRARYEPQAWLDDLDVNNNPHAVALERALDLAVSVPPALVAELLLGFEQSTVE